MPENSETTETTEPAATAPEAAPAVKPEPPKRRSLEDSLASLDDDTRSYVLGEVQKARNEARGLRERVKEADPQKAIDELTQRIGKAIGLVNETPDPAALTEQLAAQTAAAQQSRVELAVYKAAKDANGEPTALLDSRSFLEKVAAIDPADHTAIASAISAAVAENPRLAAQTTPSGPRPNPAQGSSASPPPSAGERARTAERDGDWRGAGAVKATQLLDLRDKTN